MLRSAQVRAEFAEENRGPCQVFGLMLGFVQLRAGFAENTGSVLVPGQCLGPSLQRKPCSVKFR